MKLVKAHWYYRRQLFAIFNKFDTDESGRLGFENWRVTRIETPASISGRKTCLKAN